MGCELWRSGGRRARCQEDGQVTVLAALIIVVALTLLMVLVALGSRAADRAQAQTVADAAALAAVSHTDTAAHRVATANGGEVVLTHGESAGGRRTVRADAVVGESRAVAQAEAGESSIAGLAPVMVAAVARASQLLGEDVVVVSGWRSRADQERLWEARFTNPYPVAMPGTSLHEQGLAIDVPAWQAADLAAIAALVGLSQPLPDTDPIHFIWAG